ncbi:MAG: hypothetical protein UX53_C0004G0025 [Candidatus Azambacteria bacterium GW2011_GWB2_46_37]|uniref:Ada DNA repair metal-binding domain-containing protein n=7 Tax=Candidatus Azamiibacteriota TaxID=1752741 RepID=A0A0G1Q7A1_9BACT|nr:MAG: hypothetical protein UX27_C0003G0023 [Candidatus Azambacteria bacterium GW2011_GWA2_45_90]KKU22075.1 MAG: hypothetical protein UX33_C0016G0002 [Candidatus Azambacteria bacterium GW2011_GWC1_46_13]KKU36399.1 MAG: hypothetical protein UX48_C0006G0021 [Candidatus Azambacteria bacterium GW2011_GWB1_46_27]KKU38473.1 MAG: hypothetical protein UX51_C0001G0025 [Candidatus Azambacteria bacterium GW2011_GWF2_46_32]KKU39524.1 MAG: hypothetical protein UX53_C0004G0025 [Candidatus Azambacteria bacte
MIPEHFQKVKNFAVEYQDRIVLIIGIVLIALISFGLGLLYNREISKEPIIIEEPAQYRTAESRETKSSGAAEPSAVASQEQINQSQGEVVVASRNGTKYHLPSCSGAKQIKPENKITFSSSKEAEAAGYEPASNCPGLKAP